MYGCYSKFLFNRVWKLIFVSIFFLIFDVCLTKYSYYEENIHFDKVWTPTNANCFRKYKIDSYLKQKKDDRLLVSSAFWAQSRAETFLKVRPKPSPSPCPARLTTLHQIRRIVWSAQWNYSSQKFKQRLFHFFVQLN